MRHGFHIAAFALPPLAGAWGCQVASDPPVTYVATTRILGIKAAEPEIAPGASTTVTALVAGVAGAAPTVAWSVCSRPPLPGQAVNPDCLDTSPQPYIQALGDGASVGATMPADASPATLGQPDSSGGVYLPLVARAAAGGEDATATYRLRLDQEPAGILPNRNPTITGVVAGVGGAGAPLLEGTPLPVHAGDQITLAVTLSDDSAEAYVAPQYGPAGIVVTEVLTTSWFSTAGTFTQTRSTQAEPETVLKLDDRLPPASTTIDVWAVERDERGGTDFAHRTLQLQ
jgi:hypothetical protein